MRQYTVFDKNKNVLRHGACCGRDFDLQAGADEYVIEGRADDITQKVEFDGFDDYGRPVSPRIVDRAPHELPQPPMPGPVKPDAPARITNRELQDLMKRIEQLERSNP